ncbi:T9SS sorting signal type C domain-containing protein [Flavobacterium wongokense]|uniref:T9SS sorting signal type C domain-containing protein n=1 Tax=Flavobacterium wongokense TaxID=2910674 RepID=UPI001F3AD09D|nr:T9SS sorting signal type C domain-containing protein [Flavobacterium sp. WG47]MCF6130813.1 T9SS sorting signal type C domain-containing protein [Flavobacterium sp. WG47]
MDAIITSFRTLYNGFAISGARKCILLLLLFFGFNNLHAQRFAVATGNWNGSIWATTAGGVAGSAATPTSSDAVTINTGVTVTVNVAAAANSITLTGGTSATTAINLNNSLTVTGNVSILSNSANGDRTNTIDVNSNTLTVGGNIDIQGQSTNGAHSHDAILSISTGTVSIGGNLTSAANSKSFLTFSGAGIINMTGATSAWSLNTAATFTKSTSTVNFTGATPSITTASSFNNVTIKTGSTTTATAVFAATGTFTIEAGAKYTHNASNNANGSATDIPGTTKSFATTSTVEIQKWGDGTGTALATLPSVTWGNLIFNVTTLAGSWNQQGALTTVNGNLTVQSTGGSTRELRLSGNTGYTLTIGGNLTVSGGILDLASGTAAPTINLGGNFSQTGGTFKCTGSVSSFNFTGGASSATFSTSAGTFTNTNINWVIASGKTLANNTNFAAGNWIASSRTMTVNGSFQVNQGSFTGSGAGGTWTYGSGGTLIYNFTQTTAYGPVDSTHGYWPASNGPVNVILQMQNSASINAGAVQLGAARTITGTLSTSNANGRTMFLDLNGNTFQCANITVGTTAPLTLSGTTTTTVTGNVNYSANFTINGDLKVGGNWTKASSGLTFTRNSKAVFFTGSGTTQTITVTGGGTETFDYLLIDKATAGTVTLATGTNLAIAATSGNTFEIKTSASNLDLNGQTISFSSTGGNIHANGVASTINGASGSKIAVSNGTKTFTTASGSWSLGVNVTLETNSGVNFGSNLTTLNGTFKILSGGFASGNSAPIYASGSTLEISNGGSFSLYDNSGANESAAWFRNVTATGSAQQGVPWNFVISNSSSVNWNSTGGDAFHRDINGNFTISSGSFAMSTTASGDLFIKGNFTNNGTFTANGRTVTLNGSAQSISGSTTTFQDLVFATNTSTKTLGVATTINGNLNINTGVKADLGTFGSTSATLTTGGSVRTTGTSYGGTGSPAANIDSAFFANNTGYLNVGSCATYSLASTVNTSTCIGTAATVSVTSSGANLPDGTYSVFYTLSGSNTGSGNATMTVSGGAGSGSFTTAAVLANSGSTTITINHLTNNCVTRITSNNTATITVNPNNISGSPSSTPTLCINTALTPITHSTTGATGIGTPTNLPTGVTAGWASNTITISGTPTVSGTFNYSIPLTGGCGSINATGTITVTPNNIAGSPSTTPTLCINTALTPITHSTTGATGIGSPTGLPSGVNAGWATNTITISGTPTVSGTFNYSIPLTGGCGSVNATGTITVNPVNTVGSPSSTPSLCVNTALTPITHSTTGATGIGSPTGLPSGVSAGWATNTITISGTPTAPGVYNYSIPLTGGCGSANATGTITVNGPSASVISGSTSICAGSTANIQVTITGGTSPYAVVYSGGSVGSYISGTDIPVTPTSSTTYTLTSVTDANGCVGVGNSGSALVSIDSTTSTNGGPWSNGSPSAGKSVIFDNTSISLGADFAACSLTLKNSSVVTIQSGSDVVLTGALAVEAGSTFTLDNNANLLQTIPSGTSYSNSGNIIVKRNSSALKRFDYTLWSSPVTGQGVYAFSPSTFGNRFYVYRTNTNVYNNADVGLSITGLDPNGVNGTDSNNVQFASAKGYLIRMPWDHPTAATIWNGQFTGIPHNGDINFTMTNGGAGQRFNLVGNPYPSPIDMTQFVSDNSSNITGTLYFWRETNNNTSNNAYCTWAGGTFTSNNEAQVFNPNGIIRTGQGFFVEASGAATALSFKNGQRSSDNSNQFFKSGNTNVANDVVETNRFWLNLTNASGAFSQMAAGYMTNATNEVDIYDGKNINTGSVLLNSILDNTDYTIQGKSLPFSASDVIPLSFKVTDAGEYTIAIDHVDGLFSGSQAIILKDNLMGTEHDLKIGSYSFTAAPGTSTNRFEIIYQTQLGTNNPTFTANNVIVYNQNNDFVINTGSIVMSSVKIFDIRGRLIQEKNGINSSQASISAGLSNQVLLVQITSVDGITVTKKVIR